MRSTVTLQNFNPNWALQYEEEKERIMNAIDLYILGIEHVGSTSIQGLKAKPIIDILIGVRNIEEVQQLIQPLLEVDFEYVPKPDWPDRAFFRKGLWGQGTCHVHVCELRSNEWNEKIWFRDYLRLHPVVAAQYASLKEQLAEKYGFDRHAYTAHKEPFIRSIIEKAKVEFQHK